MQLTTFRVPVRHVKTYEDKMIFSHRWQGQWLTWIVPWMYVASTKTAAWHKSCPEPHFAIRLSDAYFTRPMAA